MDQGYVHDLVSVIIPTYNRGERIVDALESVRNQCYRPIEIIVVDDGSTDATGAVLADWKAMNGDSDIAMHYVAKVNEGAPSARNEGLRRARGEYIQFLDSDDLLTPNKIARQVGVLRANKTIDYVWSRSMEVEAVPGNINALGAEASRGDSGPFVTYEGRDKVVAPMRVADGVFRRRICQRVGPWNIRLRRFQDWEYNIRAMSICERIAFVDGVGYVVVAHNDGRISSTSSGQYAEQIVDACIQLEEARYPYIDIFLKRYKCAQALLSSSILFLRSGSVRRSRAVATVARQMAPVGLLKMKAIGYDAVLQVSPRLAGYVAGRGRSAGNGR